MPFQFQAGSHRCRVHETSGALLVAGHMRTLLPVLFTVFRSSSLSLPGVQGDQCLMVIPCAKQRRTRAIAEVGISCGSHFPPLEIIISKCRMSPAITFKNGVGRGRHVPHIERAQSTHLKGAGERMYVQSCYITCATTQLSTVAPQCLLSLISGISTIAFSLPIVLVIKMPCPPTRPILEQFNDSLDCV